MLKSMFNGSNEKKYDFSGACMFYLGAIVVTLISQALAGFIAQALVGTYPDIATDGNYNTAFMIVVQVFSAVYIILFTKLNKRSFNFTYIGEGEADRRFSPMLVIAPIIAAVVLMAGMYLPTIWYGYFTRYALHIPPELGQIHIDGAASVVMIVIASVFLAPVFEETVYRGVLFNGLKTEYGVLPSVMLSALAFMLMHMSPMQVVFQFALGVLSAFVMHRSGRLISSIILHASANALALVMELTPFNGVLGGCVMWLTQNVVAAVFITLLFFVAAFAVLFVLVKFAFKKRATEPSAQEKEQSEDEAALRSLRKKDGLFKYAIGITICAVLLIVNTVVSII